MNNTEYRFDADELLADEIVVNKLDAARRQLECAIDLFFNDGDIVSQHTLVGAAHGIVYDLARQRGISGSIKDSSLVKPNERKAFIAAINWSQNYFKHAATDSNKRLVFKYRFIPFYLFDAIRLFVLLDGTIVYKFRVFLMWFQLRFPDLFSYPPGEEELGQIRISTSDPKCFMLLAKILLDEAPVSDP